MDKFENKILTFDHGIYTSDLEEKLDALGQDGWEVASLFNASSAKFVVVLKRKIQQIEEIPKDRKRKKS